MRRSILIEFLVVLGIVMALGARAHADERDFGQDVAFLRQHVTAIELHSNSHAGRVVVVPEYQGRVMTSTASGPKGISFGWINYAQVAAGFTAKQINVFGGEERFWLGPEGGQFGLFFPPGSKFEFANWQTPPLIDTKPFQLKHREDSLVRFAARDQLKNYQGTQFDLEIERQIELLTPQATSASLGLADVPIQNTAQVGYRTTNRVTNRGENNWKADSGLLSIWLLGMFKPGPETIVVVPFHTSSDVTAEQQLGPIVNDTYFGKVPSDRLRVADGVLYFRGDGKLRSKIGLTPQRAKSLCGSYDAEKRVLTIVKYNKPRNTTSYVNSMWEHQREPYRGDAINSYNDGPPEPGAKPLGPFYELETSSPALALASGAADEHIQETYHFTGAKTELDAVAKRLLGVTLQQIKSALEQ